MNYISLISLFLLLYIHCILVFTHVSVSQSYIVNSSLTSSSACTVSGYCTYCNSNELAESYCSSTYRKQLYSCNNSTSYVYRSCIDLTDPELISNYSSVLWVQFIIFIVFLVGIYYLRKRRRFILAQNSRRLERMINS